MTASRSPLSVVVCAFNGLDYTKLLVKSLRERSTLDHEIIVYSDGSSDGTLTWLREQADVRWQHDRRNRGVCTAMNRAARMATREYLFFPNTDHVLAPGWDEALIPRLSLRRVVSFQCVEPGTVPVAPIFHARNCGTRWNEYDDDAFARAAKELRRDRAVPGVNYPFVISRALWDEVAGLDERFNPGPANDPDLWYRLHFLGAEMVRAEDCLVYHFSGKSSRMADEARTERREWHEVTERNEARFEEKWGERYRYANGGLPDPGPEARARWNATHPPRVEVPTQRLRVAIDARSVEPEMQGIGLYTRSLIRALSRLRDAPYLQCYGGDVDALRRDLGIDVECHAAADDASLASANAQVFHGPAFVVPRSLRIPSVVTVHDLIFKLHPEWYPPEFVSHLARRLDESAVTARAVVAVSDCTRNDLLRHVPAARNKTVRIYEAPPEDVADAPSDALRALVREKYAGGAPYILSIGVQQRRKNATGLLRAFASMKERPPRLVLVGGRECEDPELVREIEAARLGADVTLTSHLPREEVLALLAACELFVYPSLYEGFGLPVLEAMACGAPVVCSRAGALPEVAGEAAILTDSDPESIADGIRKVLAERESLVARGRKHVKRFSWETAARETLAVYERAALDHRDLGAITTPAEPRNPTRVAVDARLLGMNSLGTGRYTSEILRALLAHNASAEYVLIGPAEVDTSVLPNVDKILQNIAAGPETLLDPVWEQYSLPTHLLGCDVYFAPTGILPVTRPCRGVTVVHDLGFEDHPEHYDERLRAHLATWVRNGCLSADRVIAVSSFTAQRVVERFNVPASRVAVVHHGCPRRSVVAPSRSDSYVLCVSSFEPNKNLGMLVDAFWTISHEWKGRLVLAGRRGRDLETVRTLIASRGLASRVEVVLEADDATLAGLYAGAALFAYPSLYEGFGLPLLEAMTAGRPVVATRIASCPEVVGDAGVLVDDLSVRSWASALRRVLTDDELRSDLSRRARVRAQDFSWEKAADETWRAIEASMEAR